MIDALNGLTVTSEILLSQMQAGWRTAKKDAVERNRRLSLDLTERADAGNTVLNPIGRSSGALRTNKRASIRF